MSKPKRPLKKSTSSKMIKMPSSKTKAQDWKTKYQQLLIRFREQTRELKKRDLLLKKSDTLVREALNQVALELKMAQQIHSTLLPLELPKISGCEFSFKFQPATGEINQGKDFYEIIAHPNKRAFSIIMSSCASYSLSALLFSARLKMMSQEAKFHKLSPHKVVSHLMAQVNQGHTLLPSQKTKKPSWLGSGKSSLLYAVVDQKTYQMSYCLIGDIAILVHYAKSKQIKQLKPSLSSLESTKQIKTCFLDLNRGDRLVLCSPGVLNLKAGKKKPHYSLLDLKRALKAEHNSSAHGLRNRIYYDLKKLNLSPPIQKDQSVLVIDIKNRILKALSLLENK